jgi:DeoR/GlpR family transcriptional regulator of sugar metabolism
MTKSKANAPDAAAPPAPANGGAKPPMTLQRRAQIAGLVQAQGGARVNELASHFQVSEVTIRSDLDQLEKEGQLLRDHGGAVAPSLGPGGGAGGRQLTGLLGIEQRGMLNIEAKRRIGRAAARLVSPGDTILMDAGTTVVEMARHLGGIMPLTAVTNALNVALELAAAAPEARVILLGGTLSREACSTLGPQAEDALGELVVQKLFLGTQAFDQEHGLTDTTPEIAQSKRAMIRAARQVILLADASKWGQSGFIKVAPLQAAQVFIVDEAFNAEAREAVERLGIELRVV